MNFGCFRLNFSFIGQNILLTPLQINNPLWGGGICARSALTNFFVRFFHPESRYSFFIPLSFALFFQFPSIFHIRIFFCEIFTKIRIFWQDFFRHFLILGYFFYSQYQGDLCFFNFFDIVYFSVIFHRVCDFFFRLKNARTHERRARARPS